MLHTEVEWSVSDQGDRLATSHAPLFHHFRQRHSRVEISDCREIPSEK